MKMVKREWKSNVKLGFALGAAKFGVPRTWL